jgi:hypothetical protein
MAYSRNEHSFPPMYLRRDQSVCYGFSDSSGFLVVLAFWPFQLSAVRAFRSFWLFFSSSSTCNKRNEKGYAHRTIHPGLPIVKYIALIEQKRK